MSRSFWQHEGRSPSVLCDVAVVGGGVLGVSTAYWLRKLYPDLHVALLEAKSLGEGASGRNAGFILQGAGTDYLGDRQRYGEEKARLIWHFTRQNRDLIQSELQGDAFDLETSGSLTVAGSEEEERRLKASVSMLRADGIPAAFFSARETNRRISGRQFYGSLYVPSGAMLNPLKLIRHIGEKSNALILEHHAVQSFEPKWHFSLLRTPNRLIRARKVIFCVGAQTSELISDVGRFSRPIRAQMLSTSRSAERWLDVPVYSHEGYFYVRQLADGRLLAGGARHKHKQRERGFSLETSSAVQDDIETYLKRHFPKSEALSVEHRWSGTMSFSADRLPVFGTVDALENAWWAAGCTGHGMAYGFRLGRLLAQVAQEDAEDELVALFSADRLTRREAQAETSTR